MVLTEKAKSILFAAENRPVEVIPCCVDFAKRFSSDKDILSDDIVAKLGVKNRFVIAHVGALGGLYLTEEIVDFLDAARSVEPATFALFLTQTDTANLITMLQKKGFDERDYFVGQVDPAEIPEYLSVADAGLSFVKATYATQSRSPTKILNISPPDYR